VQEQRYLFWCTDQRDKFEFQFRLRYRMEAATAPSILYDYHNPENHAVVQWVGFQRSLNLAKLAGALLTFEANRT
jgi:hypothetical protein